MLQFRTFIARYWLLIFLASLAVVVLVVEVSLQRRPVAGPQAATASAASPCAAAPSVDKTVTGSKTFMHLDTAEINGKALVFRDDLEHTVMMPSAPLLLEGWAVDLPNKRPGAGVVALVDDASPITGTIGGSRPDVATAFGLPALRTRIRSSHARKRSLAGPAPDFAIDPECRMFCVLSVQEPVTRNRYAVAEVDAGALSDFNTLGLSQVHAVKSRRRRSDAKPIDRLEHLESTEKEDRQGA